MWTACYVGHSYNAYTQCCVWSTHNCICLLEHPNVWPLERWLRGSILAKMASNEHQSQLKNHHQIASLNHAQLWAHLGLKELPGDEGIIEEVISRHGNYYILSIYIDETARFIILKGKIHILIVISRIPIKTINGLGSESHLLVSKLQIERYPSHKRVDHFPQMNCKVITIGRVFRGWWNYTKKCVSDYLNARYINCDTYLEIDDICHFPKQFG